MSEDRPPSLDEDSFVPVEDALGRRIAQVAAELQAALAPLLEQLAGSPPRPMRLTRADPGPGLDKSLASRLVQAAKADSGMQFLHLVPSPTGLRMLLERSRTLAAPDALARAGEAVDL